MPLMIVVMALLTVPALTTKKLHRWQGILLLCNLCGLLCDSVRAVKENNAPGGRRREASL